MTHTVVIVLADHSMDWSVPEHTISLTSVFETDPSLTGRFQIAQNGGADLVYWTGSSSAPNGTHTFCARGPETHHERPHR